MVDEKKIKLMTEIALDETKRYKEELSEGGYYRGNYIRSHVTSFLWNITIAYLLIIGLIILYKADDLLINLAKISYGTFIGVFFGIYFFLLIITCIISIYYYSAKYKYNILILREYYDKLEALKKFSAGIGEEMDNDTTTGL